MKKLILVLALVFLMIPFVFGEGNQPTQQYNKILLSPFYVSGMTQNVQYNYSVSVITPDGISGVKSAILTVDAWINPTRTFNARFNGVQCNTKNYTISTTYAGAGRGVVTFDCTNAVIPMQENIVTFVVTGGNIGSSTAWLDLTYFNNPVGNVEVHGTEYQVGDDAKVWLQLVNNTGGEVTQGVCYVDIYTPDNQEYIEHAQMNNMNHDGIYYYDLPAPDVLGVYPVIAKCYYQATSVLYFPNGNYSMIIGTAVDTTPLVDIQTQDGTFWRFNEDNNGVRRALNFTIDVGNVSGCTSVSESLLTSINVYSYAKFDSELNDNINFEIYNWSSGSWIMLPNQHLEGNVYRTTSNTISTNNITRDGLYNSTIGGFRLRFTDSVVTDGADNNFDIDQLYVACNQLSNPQWQQVAGSSEMHISDNFAGAVWNATDRNLTFYPAQLDLTNYSRIDASINASTVNITGLLNVMDVKLDNILSAFGNVASNVWNYFARYTHGEVLT